VEPPVPRSASLPSPSTATVRRAAGVLALVEALFAAPTASSAQPAPRWPTWPTEVDRVAAFLARDASGKELAGERERVAAIQELDQLATGAILPTLLQALEDGSPQVRREALRMCFEREVRACMPAAVRQWDEGGEPTVRVAALKVLALDPGPERATILIEALRDPSEVIRAQAAEFLGMAPLAPEVRRRARTALLAKLADVSAVVRRRAVLSVGLLGPGDGTLPIARLLDDPEPSVQAAAAEALGQHRDPTAAPALRRSLQAPHEPQVSQAIVDALALLPEPTVEADLLALFDDPPPGLDEGRVALAIGRRPAPGDTLVQGLVDRLDEPVRRAAALSALLMLGEHARPALAAARTRGLAPAIDLEVERLLGALEPPGPPARAARWPGPEDREGWQRRLEAHGDEHGRMQAAWALAELDPKWRVPTALAVLATPGPLAGRRPWALALAGSRGRWSAEGDDEPRTRLEGWARDRTASASDRCLALAALGARAPEGGRRPKPPAWADLAEDPEPRVRACAALALGRQGDASRLPGLLVDDRARVRTAAALALALVEPRRLHRTATTRLATLAASDPDAAVRAAARHALARDRETAVEGRPGLFFMRVEPYAWRDPPRWIEVDDGSEHLWVPAEGSGPWRWALVPGLPKARPRDPSTAEIAPPEAFGTF
jgi:HEAT repeat protein